MPVVSVLMPCYNAASTLPEALRSRQQQTLSEFEIIAVDDGPEDGTLPGLEQFPAGDSRLRMVSIPHAGITAALNAGLAFCRAPYITRMDADE
jgi:glycosyltransferase involved in cell wall biosynthesis